MFVLLLVLLPALVASAPEPPETPCIYSGETYEVGQTFTAADGCNTCQCMSTGRAFCTRRGCTKVEEPEVAEDVRDGSVVCSYGMRKFVADEHFQIHCSDCVCGPDGVIECEEEKPCCLYLDKKSKTKRAYVGEQYYNGCTKCECQAASDGATFAACGARTCDKKCVYSNWEGAWGYAKSSGQEVEYLDLEAGCNKEHCTCEKNDEGRGEINCNMANGEPRPCIEAD